MSITFPTTIDNLTNPSSTDTLDSPDHADQHSDTNDAIEALETKVGVDSSAVTSSHDYKIDALETSVASMVETVIGTIYPVGSIYTSTLSTNPATLFGFGTWAAFGSGKTLVGVDTGDADFNEVEETGGQKTTRHAYPVTPLNSSKFQDPGAAYLAAVRDDIDSYLTGGGSSSTSTSTTVEAVGGTVGTTGTTNTEVSHDRYTATNLQPYITVYFFKRTA